MGKTTVAVALVVLVVAACGVVVLRDGAAQPTPAASTRLHFSPDDTRPEDCRPARSPANQPCLGQALGNIAYHDSPAKALDVLQRLARTDAVVAGGCHVLTHRIGGASLARPGVGLSRALADGTPLCISGYYHGVVEHWIASHGASEARRLAADPYVACSGLETGTPQRRDCVHGAGHGVALALGGDIEAGIAACEREPEEAGTCAGGMFMEVHYFGRVREPDRSVATCLKVALRYRSICIRGIGGGALATTSPSEWETAATVCGELPHDWRNTCAVALGETVAELSAYDQLVITRTCRSAGALEGACLDGARTVRARVAEEVGRG